jgi:hypothetical protein
MECIGKMAPSPANTVLIEILQVQDLFRMGKLALVSWRRRFPTNRTCRYHHRKSNALQKALTCHSIAFRSNRRSKDNPLSSVLSFGKLSNNQANQNKTLKDETPIKLLQETQQQIVSDHQIIERPSIDVKLSTSL